MSERGALLPTLDRLFAGRRDSILTVEAFLEARVFDFEVGLHEIELAAERRERSIGLQRSSQ